MKKKFVLSISKWNLLWSSPSPFAISSLLFNTISLTANNAILAWL